MKNNNILKSILLMTAMFFAIVLSAGIASAVFSVTVEPDAISTPGPNEFTFYVTNLGNDYTETIYQVRIDGAGDFTDITCPTSITGSWGPWDRIAEDTDYCTYQTTPGGIPEGETEEFASIWATETTSGDLQFSVETRITGDGGETNLTSYILVDVESPTATIDPEEELEEWQSEDFFVDIEWEDDYELDTCYYQFGVSAPVEIDCSETDYYDDSYEVTVDTSDCDVEGEDTCVLTAWAIDSIGNEGEEDVEYVSIDLSMPTSSALAMPEFWSDIEGVDIPYEYSDTLSGVERVRLYYRVDGGDWTYKTYESGVGVDGLFEDVDFLATGEGLYEFHTLAIDTASNEEPDKGTGLDPLPDAEASTLIDTTEPSFSIDTPEDEDWVDGEPFLVETDEIIEESSGVAGCYAIYEDSEGVFTDPTELVYDGTICSGEVSIPTNPAAEGEGTLYVYVTDIAGNEGEDSIDLGFDYSNPEVYIDYPDEDFVYIEDGDSVWLGGEICDYGSGVYDYYIYVNDQYYDDGYGDGDECVDIDEDLWDLVPGNEYTVEVIAYDGMDFMGSDDVTFELLAEYTGIYLEQGWNLMSLPLIPQSPIEEVLETGMGGDWEELVEVVWAYDALTDTWSWYMPGDLDSTLTEMVDGYGYWIYLNDPTEFIVRGVELPVGPGEMPEYTVYSGWNLIGFKSTESMDAYTDWGGGYLDSLTESWFDEPNLPIEYDTDYGFFSVWEMEPGHGYWLYADEEGIIAPPIG